MPTNKLWLEHTERAAWESVEALRQKLAAAEERVARLAPASESWRVILEALDTAKQRHGIDKDSYSEIATCLVERLATREARLTELEAELERARRAEVVAGAALSARSYDAEPLDDRHAEPGESNARRFARLVARRSKLAPSPKQSPEALLRSIEHLLEELDDVPISESADAAIELGVVAMRLERLASRERRRARSEDAVSHRRRSADLDDDLD
jgi:chromosome segregation ATPase